jgi:photosynthetic reaction center M subunit
MAIQSFGERPVIDADIGGSNGRIGQPIHIQLLDFFGETQLGPIYLGVWGAIAFISGSMFAFIWLMTMFAQVGYNPVAFVKYFAVLQIDPPSAAYGLRWAPFNQGGWWLTSTFFLTLSLLAWEMRLWTRALAHNIKPYLAYGFSSALALYLVIYIFRPMAMGNWSEAPSHGIKALLDWTNNVSVRYGNFYYNPFHMVSIFFLLGSTVLLSMHGATVWSAEKFGAHEEIAEIEAPGTGTERAQLLWRWVMGFNANAYSIHLWAFWFAWLMGITGAIGIFISGTLVHDWFKWAIEAGVNYPQLSFPNVSVPPPPPLPTVVPPGM